MDFPTLFSDTELDTVIDTIRAQGTTPERKLLSDPEQLIQSIAALHDRFPHITQKIEALWGSDELQTYLSKLITETKRSNGDIRRGFPEDAMAHLLKIHNIHFRSIGKPIQYPYWKDPRRAN